MKKIKVTQIRSVIKRNETQKRTIQALGLGKINRSRVHDDSPSIRGMINTVKHLVMVEDLSAEKTTEEREKQTPKVSAAKTAETGKKTGDAAKLSEDEETPEDTKEVEKSAAEMKQEKTTKETS
jgi:large subunit ribosomal protein L30